MADDVSRPDAPMQAGTRRRIAVAVLVVLALAAATVTARWLYTKEEADAPVEAVRSLLEAARSGDVGAALALTEDEPPGSAALLVPEALRDDWTIGELTLRSWSPRSGLASVGATIIGPEGTEVAGSFDLDLTDDGWKVTDPYTTLSVPQLPLPYLEVNGHTVPVGPEDSGDFALLPGVYRLYEHPPELLAYDQPPIIALGHRSVAADPSTPDGFLGFTVAEGTDADVTAQVRAYLAACIADAPEQFGCPFGLHASNVDIDGFEAGPDRHWEIVEYPQAAAAVTGPMLTPEQLVLLVRTEGLARVTAEDQHTGAEAVLECPITTTGLYFWLDGTGQYAVGPNGDPDAPADPDGTVWDHGYQSWCETV